MTKRAKSPDFKYMRTLEALDNETVSISGTARNLRLSAQNEEKIESLLNSPLTKKSNSSKNNKLVLSPMGLQSSPLSNDLPQRDDKTSNKQLNLYGSSQLEGCCGDFCNFDVSYLQDPSLASSVSPGFIRTADIKSDLRRKLEAPAADSVERKKFDSDAAAQLSEKLKGGDHGSILRKKYSSIKSLHSSSLSSLPKLNDSKSRSRVISYHAVIQARNEMPLVKLLLLRHKNREPGEYCTEENYRDVVGGAKLPSKYYREVTCCESCYQVYQLVDSARLASIQKWSRKKPANPADTAAVASSLGQSKAALTRGTTAGVYQDDPDLMANASIRVATHAIEGLTKLDIAEIRTLAKPPTAVVVVLEAVTGLLTGQVLSFQDTRRLMGNGESFLQLLRTFGVSSVDPARLQLLDVYVSNSIFRPEYVVDVSRCAAKFCAWVLGIVQAAQWMHGVGQPKTGLLVSPDTAAQDLPGVTPGATNMQAAENKGETFEEKLRRRKAKKMSSTTQPVVQSPAPAPLTSLAFMATMPMSRPTVPRRLDEAASLQPPDNEDYTGGIKKGARQRQGLASAQLKATQRLASQAKGGVLPTGKAAEFLCADGVTLMQYAVEGEFSKDAESCNFVVVHDFFDTCDATSILMKPITSRHPGCKVLCFNYPGQANTVWPRPTQTERDRGAKEPVLNNDWLADRINELLQHTERTSDFVLFSPFHLVGMGNGTCIAAAFAQRWGAHEMYAGFLRSVVSINGFLYPDSQLAATLQSAAQTFESAPRTRPDIPVAFWSRFLFSDEYIAKVDAKLALNIYTAVSNPITNDGRLKITRGYLQHRDLRGGLSPDKIPDRSNYYTDVSDPQPLSPVTVPLILLQSTENLLVNASNVDSFLVGRHAKHLWSHQQNTAADYVAHNAHDGTALPWVGTLSSKPETYAKCSVLGKSGLRMLLETLQSASGAFVMWCRSGHCVQQECKQALLDLLDALAAPSEEYFGLPRLEPVKRLAGIKVDVPLSFVPKVDVLFQLEPSTREVPPELLREPSRKPVPRSRPAASEERVATAEGTQTDFPDITSHTVMSPHQTEVNVDTLKSESGSDEDEKDGRGGRRFQPVRGSTVDEDMELYVGTAEVAADDALESTTKSNLSELSCPGHLLDSNIVITETTDLMGAPRPTREALLGQLRELDAAILAEQRDVPRVSTRAQRDKKEWTDVVPSVESALALEAALRKQEAAFYSREDALQTKMDAVTVASAEELERAVAERRLQYEREDEALLEGLRQELEERRRLRDEAEVQRRLQAREVEAALVQSGLLAEYAPPPDEGEAVQEMPPTNYGLPTELPPGLGVVRDTVGVLDGMIADEAQALAMGVVFMEDFDQVKRKMLQRQMERDQRLSSLSAEEQQLLYDESAAVIQRYRRGFVGRRRYGALRLLYEQEMVANRGITALQAEVRRRQAVRRVALIRFLKYEDIKHGRCALHIQTNFRGYQARKYVEGLRRNRAAVAIQRIMRGVLGRAVAQRERDILMFLQRKNDAALAIQSAWRMKVAKEEFRSVRIHALAVIEIQRCFRGYMGRKKAFRRRQWEAATPGPERIKLGLTLIEDSKVAFERQQEELDAIHRAQERAEARVSHIHADLRESEKELLVLERELQEIDQIERDLIHLTHEKDLLSKGISDAAGLVRTTQPGSDGSVVTGKEHLQVVDPDAERRNKAEAFALEMTIQIKRAEREKKRQELETEFAIVFQEVEKKKQALDRLETSLADMEATRERKDREFRRLQTNLMQLLLEQKQELDSLREKGIELETATAMTASAAVATANKAMEHEKQSKAMFSQTEELMKFQFMSMSLSYFSSLNMLKQLRDMNADTTSAAVASSANAAVAASASAIAANLPNIQKLDIGADDFVELSIQKKRAEIAAAEQAEREAKKSQQTPMPDSVSLWTVSDVCRWMDSLLLSQYNDAFKEARIDGPFLLELREEDMVEVLGITHKLHVRKIIVSREKLRPLSDMEMSMKSTVEREDFAESIRSGTSRVSGPDGVPAIDVIFSQARNGHIKRVEEAINLGFKIDTEDEKGNTLLLVGAQNSNKRLVELLLFRGANINHQNAQGNTALHFALTYDPDGTLGEYLIEHGANDTLENIHGLTPYDGVG